MELSQQAGNGAGADGRLSRHARRALLAIALILLAAERVAAVFAVGINWDEFALLDRARISYESGELVTGGRPGLAVMALLSFVANCGDEIATVHSARLLWLGFTAAFLAGLAVLIAQLQQRRERRASDALLGVCLLALVPAFLEWSLQVRADQIALAAGVWGGVALLASQRSPGWALLAGLLFGIGLLASQKILYLGALVALLTVGRLWLTRDLRPGREALRAALSLGVFAGVVLAYRSAVAVAFDVESSHASQDVVSVASVARGMGPFEFYRETLGLRQYRDMLPTLLPHMALALGLMAASLRAVRRRTYTRELTLAWAVLLLGLAVGAFHAGAFFYFWMTLGVFPAVAFAVARAPLWELLRDSLALRGDAERAALPRLLAIVFWLALVLPGLLQMSLTRWDTQEQQRESLAFIHRNFSKETAGFHPERSPFCWRGEQPLPPFFSMTIYQHLDGPDPARNRHHLERMLATFEERPVAFLLESFRLNQFPVELRRFWAKHYQPYRGSVFVAGRNLEGSAGTHSEFELIVPGHYRWIPRDGPRELHIDGQVVPAGGILELEPGAHTARVIDDATEGMLVLALDDPPGLAPLKFYKAY